MKKFLILMIILMVGVSGVFAQTITYDELEASFSQFSTDVAESLPFASTIGLNWSDATVRSFPHFGVGLTVGAVMIPAEAFTDLADVMGFDLPDEITDSSIGVPLPGYTLEGRIGGLILPFDIGVKLGGHAEVLVDSAMQTNIKGIYAIGDLTGGMLLAHKASAEGIVAAKNICGQSEARMIAHLRELPSGEGAGDPS